MRHKKFARSLACASIFATLMLFAGQVRAQFVPGGIVLSQEVGPQSTQIGFKEYKYVAGTWSVVATYTVAASSATGAQNGIVNATSGKDGYYSLSAERDQIVLTGYDATSAITSSNLTSGTTYKRELATFDYAGNYHYVFETTLIPSSDDARGGASSGGNYYLGGKAGGVVYYNAASTPANGYSMAPTYNVNNEVIGVYNGNVYLSSATTLLGVWELGSGGIPTSTVTATSGTQVAGENSSGGPQQFAISPDGNTMYVASTTYGILKYTLNSATGIYSVTPTGTYSTETEASGYGKPGIVYGVACAGITVDFTNLAQPTIYAVQNDNENLITMQDVGSTLTSSAVTTINTTTAIDKGVYLAPACYANPTAVSTSICSGATATFLISGNPTGTVTYNINGGSSLTPTIPANGIYTVTVASASATTSLNVLSINTATCGTYALSNQAIVTVNPLPTGINPTASPNPVCTGNNITLTGTVSGASTYLWTGPAGSGYTSSSQNPAAFAAASTSAGIYTFTATTALGCYTTAATTAVTVNTSPASPTINASPLSLLSGSGTSSTLSFTGNSTDVVSYTWSGASANTITIGGTGTGTVSETPTVTTTYSITSTANAAGTCSLTVTGQNVTVNVGNPTCQISTSPSTVTGTETVCSTTGGNIYFINGTPTAVVGYTDGVSTYSVTLNGSGSYTLAVTPSANTTYSLQTINYGVYSGSLTGNVTVTVNASPAGISGTLSVCQGTTTALTDAGGGTWASSNTSIASVNSSGVVMGVLVNTATITYTISNLCTATAVVTVNAAPTVSAISGVAGSCLGGGTTSLSDGTSSGVWSSGNTSTATVDVSGNVTAVADGTTTISYTVTNLGCSATATLNFTVSPVPTVNAISGVTSVNTTGVITLSDATTGGVWSSTNTSAATVDGSGNVTGIALGTTTISYTVTNACAATAATITMTDVDNATTYVWQPTTATTWSSAGNWSPIGIPGTDPGDIAVFSVNPTSATAAITLSSGATSLGALSVSSARTKGLVVENTPGAISTLQLNGQTLSGQANTIISNQTPYASTAYIDSIGTAGAGGSLALHVNTTGGAYISATLGGVAGSTTKAANTTYINAPITTSSSQPITYLGGGTIDLLNNTIGYNGGLLELAGRNSAMTGGLIIGDANYDGTPDWGNSGQVEIDSSSALPATGTYTITVNNNSVLYLTNAAAMNFPNANATYLINGGGDGWNSGALRLKDAAGITIAGKVVVGANGAVITDASAGDIYTYTGPITGTGQLQFQGAGTSSLTATGNTWATTQIGNGLVIVTSGGSFSQGSLNYDNTSTNTIGVTFNQPTQTIAGLYNISSATAGSYSLTLNSDALTINQPSGTSNCVGTSTIPFYVLGNGSITYNGPGTLVLGASGSNLSGGITVNSGNLYLAPLLGTTTTMNSPITLAGGVFGTTGIGAASAVNVNSLTVTSNSTLAVDPTASHSINFANSASAVWTGSLTVTGWVGSTGVYSTSAGATGSKGKIFFGNSGSGLTAAQLASIEFYDGTNYYPATILSTGELVPAPAISTTAVAYGPYCNGVGNSLSVAFTEAGTFTGTYSVQLSNASGSFASPTVIGSGAASPIPASIPSGTAAGTGYRVRVVNSAPAINGNDNGSNINEVAAPTAYTLNGSGAVCPGSGVDMQLTGSQSGVDYQLYNGSSAVGGVMTGSGPVIDFGAQAAAGTYTVLATSTGTGACTMAMNGSGSVTVNPVPGISITGTTLITPGSTATLTINDSNTYNTGNGDVVAFTDGVSTYSVTMSHGSQTFTTPSLSATTSYSVTSASTPLGCNVTVTGQVATVYVSATPTAIITGATTICPASQGGAADLTFTGTASGVVNYTDGVSTYSVALSSGSGGVGTADIVVSPAATTTYSLISIVSSGTYTLSGSAAVTISTLPTLYSVTGGGYCAGTAGSNIGLSGSDNSSVTYQLYDGSSSAIGDPVNGIGGGAISFGVYSTVATTYTVLATNSLGCYDVMSGSATIVENSLPTAYSVTGTGSYCASGSGIPVGMGNSDNSGTTYQLYNGATLVGSPMAGTSASFNFGTSYTVGVYTVLATITSTGCTNAMNGSAIITTVAPLTAGTISGPSVINVSGSMTLSDPTAAAGGTWSSTNTSMATIGSTGVLTAVAAGTTTISYTTTNICGTVAGTNVITVNATTAGEVVMSQVYGGGGGTGATYKNQFVELFNSSANAVTMTNWSIQFGTTSSAWTSNTFSGTIAAHSYFLIELSGGPTGATLPTPDYTGTLVMNKTNGIVALVANGNTITSVPTGNVVTDMAADNIVDFVGYGTGTSYLAADAAPAGTSASLSIFRGLNGCSNTYNNGVDFSTGVPSARNSSSPTNICTTPTAYYSKASGNLDATTTWGTGTDGSGANPPDFATSLQTFHIANGNSGNISGAWSITGTGSALNVDYGTDFAITSYAVNASVNVGAGRTLTIANTTQPTLSGLDPASTVVYSGLSGVAIPAAPVYGSITFANTAVTSTTAATLSFSGNLSLTGSATFNSPATNLLPNGTGNQTISGNGTTLNINTFTNDKTTGTLTLATGTTLYLADNFIMALANGVTDQFIDNGNAITVVNNVELSGTAASYNFTGTLLLNGSGSGSQNIEGAGSGLCVAAFYNVVIEGGLQVKLNPASGGSLTVKGNLIFTSAAIGKLNFEGDTLKLGGSFADSTATDLLTMSTVGSMLEFNGSSAQTYYSAVSGGNTVANVFMNNSAGLTLYSPLNVSAALTLTSGNITTGSNALTLTATGTATGENAASYVNGNLVENVHSGGISSLFFPVGDATYAPVNLAYGAVVTGGSVEVSATSGAYSQVATSYLNPANYVNRYWTITDNGTSASTTTVNAMFDYNVGDMTGAGNSGYSITEYTTGWAVMPSITNATSGISPLPANSSTSTGISGASYSGSYMIGAPDCTGATGGTANASATAICGTGTSNLGLSGSSAGAGITYQWQSSATGSGYTTISGATSSSYSTPTLSSTTYYNCVVGCLFTSTTATSAAVTVSVNPLPTVDPISGVQSVCVSSITTLTDATASGAWSASGGNATVDGSGNVSGVSSGTANITYTVTNGSSCTNFVTAVVTVNPLTNAGSITGGSIATIGTPLTCTDVVSGGTWSASNSNATVSGGVVSGVSAGSVTISYGVTGICGTTYATDLITVTGVSMTAPDNVCAGNTITLTNATPGGTWSMSNLVATINGSTGVVTASNTYTGTATVTYTVGSVHTTMVITVNPNPAGIQGATNECVGTTVILSDATAGGTWSATGNVVISGAGTLVADSTSGTATVTYTLPTGCYVTAMNTIKANPLPIQGTKTICVGGVTILSDATSGSVTWSSNNTAIATAAGGDITGVSAGQAIITYLINTGCATTTTVTVISAAAISGNSGPICSGSTLSLSSGAGIWSSSNTIIASVNTSGLVTAVSSGQATISFAPTGTGGCVATTVVTINSAPAINGASSVCATGTTTLSDGVSGGTWASSNMSYATVGSISGTVSGVAAGSVVITYTTPTTACLVTTTLTVTPGTPAIGIPGGVCVGNTITLTDATGGGTWTSSNTALGTVDGSGHVTGLGSGTITISYTAGGCAATGSVSINALPGAINGPAAICLGTPTSLTDAISGGAWSVSGGTATITGSTGIITGTSGGSATVSYTLTTGCSSSKMITVISTTGSINGNTAICTGSMITLTDGTSGGTWTSANTAVVTVGSSTGLVSGIGSGTTTITYSISGCYTTAIATVNGAVGVIKGGTSVCQGATLSISDATAGGTWTSSSTAIATVGASTGSPVIISAVNTGSPVAATVIISYATAGCSTSATITVNPIPTAINGTLSLCPSTSTTLTDASASGVWSMSSLDASVVGSTGVVTASASYIGTATVSYSIGSCAATAIMTVNPNPKAIQGATTECPGVTTLLSDATAGGTWTGGGDATVSGTGSAGTLVAGVVGGSATVTYTLPLTGCMVTGSNTIYASPAAIMGNFNLCVGLVNILSDASPVNTWSSSNTTIATAAGGDITGVAAGTATISFKTGAAGTCITTQVITVNAMPVVTAINGPATISHSGSPISISDATSGGIWTSSNTSVITLSGSTGSPVFATAVTTSGSSVISYAVTLLGCKTTVTKNYSASTATHPGGGNATVYAGGTVIISSDITGGNWSSSDNSIATVDANGIVAGIAPGNVTVTHEITGDDGNVTTEVNNVTVSALPISISLVPNPNKGTFVVKGTMGTETNEEVTLEVTDLLGQVIYKASAIAQQGKLNETVSLTNALANGMYILNVQSKTGHTTVHFVIEQ